MGDNNIKGLKNYGKLTLREISQRSSKNNFKKPLTYFIEH